MPCPDGFVAGRRLPLRRRSRVLQKGPESTACRLPATHRMTAPAMRMPAGVYSWAIANSARQPKIDRQKGMLCLDGGLPRIGRQRASMRAPSSRFSRAGQPADQPRATRYSRAERTTRWPTQTPAGTTSVRRRKP